MDRKTLMGLVREMDCPKDYEKFFRFAHSYILRIRSAENTPALTDEQVKSRFFNTVKEIKRIMDMSRSGVELESLKNALGISGKNKQAVCAWCEDILKLKLKAASATSEELDYLMGMCARKCKVKSKGIGLYLTDMKH